MVSSPMVHKNKPLGSTKIQVFINLGDFIIVDTALVISTVLGSCVAVCLFDESNGIAGMNHFLLPKNLSGKEPSQEKISSRYGTVAMEKLIKGMLDLGANKSSLKAKVFGGSSLIQNSQKATIPIGQANIQFALEFLRTENISIVSQDVGGSAGRLIRFDTATFDVWKKSLNKSLLTD